MLVGDLVVVTNCDLNRVAEPRCYNMGRKALSINSVERVDLRF
jgi:hypothetical protein